MLRYIFLCTFRNKILYNQILKEKMKSTKSSAIKDKHYIANSTKIKLLFQVVLYFKRLSYYKTFVCIYPSVI